MTAVQILLTVAVGVAGVIAWFGARHFRSRRATDSTPEPMEFEPEIDTLPEVRTDEVEVTSPWAGDPGVPKQRRRRAGRPAAG